VGEGELAHLFVKKWGWGKQPTQTLGGTPCVLDITTSHTKQVKIGC